MRNVITTGRSCVLSTSATEYSANAIPCLPSQPASMLWSLIPTSWMYNENKVDRHSCKYPSFIRILYFSVIRKIKQVYQTHLYGVWALIQSSSQCFSSSHSYVVVNMGKCFEKSRIFSPKVIPIPIPYILSRLCNRLNTRQAIFNQKELMSENILK